MRDILNHDKTHFPRQDNQYHRQTSYCGQSDISIQLNYDGWDGDMISIHPMGLCLNPFAPGPQQRRAKDDMGIRNVFCRHRMILKQGAGTLMTPGTQQRRAEDGTGIKNVFCSHGTILKQGVGTLMTHLLLVYLFTWVTSLCLCLPRRIALLTSS